jgi:hypothetical protein
MPGPNAQHKGAHHMLRLVKKLIRAALPRPWRLAIDRMRETPDRVDQIERHFQRLSALALLEKYESLGGDRALGSLINRYDQTVYSQHGQDGILLYIFSQAGVTNRRFVEFGMGDGRECNTANLSLNYGWGGLLMDVNEENVSAARRYYGERLGARSSDVTIVHCKVTRENINEVLERNGYKGEIDLLSIDIDGNDYWVWQAITVIDPRVAVVEYNAILGCERSITIPYDPNFVVGKRWSYFYHGASLPALTKLASSKGYVLVGCDLQGTDAFFVRKDLAAGKLSEVSAEAAYFPQLLRSKTLTPREQFESIRHLDFHTV